AAKERKHDQARKDGCGGSQPHYEIAEFLRFLRETRHKRRHHIEAARKKTQETQADERTNEGLDVRRSKGEIVNPVPKRIARQCRLIIHFLHPQNIETLFAASFGDGDLSGALDEGQRETLNPGAKSWSSKPLARLPPTESLLSFVK